MPQELKFRMEDVEVALRRSAGVITSAAQILEQAYGTCSPRTLRYYVAKYPRLKKAIYEAIETNLDLAESKLVSGISEGNMTAIIFYLKTKGKHRGYVQRVEATGIDGEAVQHRVKHTGRVKFKIDPVEAYRQLLED
jgi:hypothetical protein